MRQSFYVSRHRHPTLLLLLKKKSTCNIMLLISVLSDINRWDYGLRSILFHKNEVSPKYVTINQTKSVIVVAEFSINI
jgi:hypothetical protein